jgi:hypothetical protein
LLVNSPNEAAHKDVLIVRLGNASVAAPFTSRVPSLKAAADLIRQDRFNLLSELMQQQIMMLESIIVAYTMAALSLHIVSSSKHPMLADFMAVPSLRLHPLHAQAATCIFALLFGSDITPPQFVYVTCR